MQDFERLGRSLEAAWRGRDFDEQVFPQLSCELLQEFFRSGDPTVETLWPWLTECGPFPEQVDPSSKFGAPALTVYRGARFHIDLYFWTDGTTTVHQHAFCGAFHVLRGSSLHGVYRWDSTARVNTSLQFGTLALEHMELLPTGTTLPIQGGAAYIHSLFHLERPSVSVVARTYRNPDQLPQYDYWPPSVAIDPTGSTQRQTKVLQYLEMLHQTRSPAWGACARDLMREDLHTVCRFLDDCVQLDVGMEEISALLAAAEQHHPEALIAHLRRALKEAKRRRALIARRSEFQEPHHRFFLAVLLNAPDRAAALRLMEQRFPGEDGATVAGNLLEELASTETPAGPGLGMRLDDVTLLGARCLLRGMSPEQALEAYRSHYGAEQLQGREGDLLALLDVLRGAPLLAPLFA